jgi:hypothetical protein
LQEGLEGGQEQARRLGRFELTQDAQALAGDLVDSFLLGRETVPGGQDEGMMAGEAGEVGGPGVEVARMSDDDQECAGSLRRDGGGSQGSGGTPGPIDGPGAAVAQGRKQVREAFCALEDGVEIGEFFDCWRSNDSHEILPV